MKNIIILGANADIGANITKYYLNSGAQVIGTYRRRKPKINNGICNQLILRKCDITKDEDISKLGKFVKKKKFKWDLIFSSIGTTEPIGKFFDLKFKNLKRSIEINLTGQIKAIHTLYPFKKKKVCNIVFLAGGGTNSSFARYSAYTLSKIALIKFCELIDDENRDINIFIIGPGFTRTKGHLETIRAGERKAGKNFFREKKFMDSKKKGTKFKTIYDCINWGIKVGRRTVGGRNLSVVHDNWGSVELRQKLKKDINMFKLRRHRNMFKLKEQ
uniref:Putative short chain dehydrogenase n=1 Tax=uncultured marine microorganism HF4000_133G03 TaxID=455521 RepID=B3T205_9ZZZZ|nr:putative short chain dehydrogenase [uncultured marine microorganism HF4000_133G03]